VPSPTLIRFGEVAFYHGAMVQPPEKESLQALTVRLPESDYKLLRALAFVTDESINDIVGTAIRRVLHDAALRPGLEGLLQSAQDLRPGRQLPRNPHGKGRRK
jgi:hypothetical protein